MPRMTYIITFTKSRAVTTLFVAIISVVSANQCYAEDLWQYLEQEGPSLDLMALESVNDHAVFIGARLESPSLQASEPSAMGKGASNILHKRLYIFSVNQKETIEWARGYSGIPDVNEIFSVDKTDSDRICIAYGSHYIGDEFINPVILQVDKKGKIIWANKKAIKESGLSPGKLVQVANLDSIRVTSAPNNGCTLALVLRVIGNKDNATNESYQLMVFSFDQHGNATWNYKQDTRLYGKMFLVRNKDARQYTVVQTNQSRDAAIEAMMMARAFRPSTSVTMLSHGGKQTAHYEEIEDLANVWVKAVSDSTGKEIVLAGNSRRAWAGQLGGDGRVKNVFEKLEGEFSYVRQAKSGSFLFTLHDGVIRTSKTMELDLNKSINEVVQKKYSNPFLEKQITEKLPVQNMVQLGKNTYLMLYRLSNKVLKVRLNQ